MNELDLAGLSGFFLIYSRVREIGSDSRILYLCAICCDIYIIIVYVSYNLYKGSIVLVAIKLFSIKKALLYISYENYGCYIYLSK
jgi:uncharacterized membrane protein